MQQVQYNKTCITLKRNLRIDWKFGNKLISSISTELSHKSSMLGSQNGRLSGVVHYYYCKDARVLTTETDKRTRHIKETIWIRKANETMNRDDGATNLVTCATHFSPKLNPTNCYLGIHERIIICLCICQKEKKRPR